MNKRTESMFLQLCAVVLIFAPMAKAEILVFTDQAEFEMAAMMAGADFVGVEDFESSNAPPQAFVGDFGDDVVLEAGTPLLNADGFGFENGLATPLINVFFTGQGRRDMILLGEQAAFGFDMNQQIALSVPSDAVGPLDFIDVTNIEVANDTATAIGFDLYSSDSLASFNGDFDLAVFDEDGVSLLTNLFFNLGFEAFVGVVATEGERLQTLTIDNLHSAFFGGEIIDNVQVWKEVSFLLGDVNGDMVVDLLDVAPFVNLLSNNGFQPEADINMDGVVDLLDVNPFVKLLSAG